jgi:hypothetical protein
MPTLRDSAQQEPAERKRDSAQQEHAKRKRDSAQQEPMLEFAWTLAHRENQR